MIVLCTTLPHLNHFRKEEQFSDYACLSIHGIVGSCVHIPLPTCESEERPLVENVLDHRDTSLTTVV